MWRPTVGPVEDTPIAVMDGRTIAPENLHTVHSLGHAFAMPDSYFEISSSPTQKWYYLGGQRTDEVLFIKQYDSEEGVCKSMCLPSLCLEVISKSDILIAKELLIPRSTIL